MDSNQPPMNRQMDHLGVNKMGKNIKKSPLHQPNFATAAGRQQPQPQVYNINKNDFRNVVQQLTGSPLRDPPPPRPPQNNPKPPNNRLQRVRPPPLAPTGRPQVPIHHHHPNMPIRVPAAQGMPYANNMGRPAQVHYDHQPSPNMMMLPPTPTDVWTNTTESPISAYMRYLQNSIMESGPGQPQAHLRPQVPGQNLHQPHLLPNPGMPPRVNGPPQNLPSPRFNGPPTLLPSPRMNGPLSGLPSPRANGPPPLLPSPTSQFLLPSPTGFLNLLSPRSPYPLFSPGYENPPPISPNFSFASMGQSGILGPGPHPPPSPGYGFPLSPSGFFPLPSPRWRNQ